tara:strand:+ start:10292 stop:11836 length:1545 start_codon:yes stop_codon:yes gene_type:complete
MILDEFEFLTMLGEGAFATVWAARKVGDGGGKNNDNNHSKKLYAVKHMKQSIDPTTGQDLLTTAEFRSLRAIPRHINVLRPVQVAREKGSVFLVTEWCDTDLLKVLEKTKSIGLSGLPEQTVRAAMRGLLSAISHVHANKWTHRDIKPENVLISIGQIKLADFGEAAEWNSNEIGQSYVGTRWYRGPEQFFGIFNKSGINTHMGASDVWATGCVMAECLLGRALFRGTSGRDMLRKIGELIGEDQSMTDDVKRAWSDKSGGYAPSGADRFVETFRGVGPNTISLLKELLRSDPGRRVTARDALTHPFFTDGNENENGVFVPKTQSKGTSNVMSTGRATGTTHPSTSSTSNQMNAKAHQRAEALRQRRAVDSSSSDDEFDFDDSNFSSSSSAPAPRANVGSTELSKDSSSVEFEIPTEPTRDALAAMVEIREKMIGGSEASAPVPAKPVEKVLPKEEKKTNSPPQMDPVQVVTKATAAVNLRDDSSSDDEFDHAPMRPAGGARAGEARAGRRILG